MKKLKTQSYIYKNKIPRCVFVWIFVLYMILLPTSHNASSTQEISSEKSQVEDSMISNEPHISAVPKVKVSQKTKHKSFNKEENPKKKKKKQITKNTTKLEVNRQQKLSLLKVKKKSDEETKITKAKKSTFKTLRRADEQEHKIIKDKSGSKKERRITKNESTKISNTNQLMETSNSTQENKETDIPIIILDDEEGEEENETDVTSTITNKEADELSTKKKVNAFIQEFLLNVFGQPNNEDEENPETTNTDISPENLNANSKNTSNSDISEMPSVSSQYLNENENQQNCTLTHYDERQIQTINDLSSTSMNYSESTESEPYIFPFLEISEIDDFFLAINQIISTTQLQKELSHLNLPNIFRDIFSCGRLTNNEGDMSKYKNAHCPFKKFLYFLENHHTFMIPLENSKNMLDLLSTKEFLSLTVLFLSISNHPMFLKQKYYIRRKLVKRKEAMETNKLMHDSIIDVLYYKPQVCMDYMYSEPDPLYFAICTMLYSVNFMNQNTDIKLLDEYKMLLQSIDFFTGFYSKMELLHELIKSNHLIEKKVFVEKYSKIHESIYSTLSYILKRIDSLYCSTVCELRKYAEHERFFTEIVHSKLGNLILKRFILYSKENGAHDYLTIYFKNYILHSHKILNELKRKDKTSRVGSTSTFTVATKEQSQRLMDVVILYAYVRIFYLIWMRIKEHVDMITKSTNSFIYGHALTRKISDLYTDLCNCRDTQTLCYLGSNLLNVMIKNKKYIYWMGSLYNIIYLINNQALQLYSHIHLTKSKMIIDEEQHTKGITIVKRIQKLYQDLFKHAECT